MLSVCDVVMKAPATALLHKTPTAKLNAKKIQNRPFGQILLSTVRLHVHKTRLRRRFSATTRSFVRYVRSRLDTPSPSPHVPIRPAFTRFGDTSETKRIR
jgi:hypothetical protein